jgi:hypothetical protein
MCLVCDFSKHVDSKVKCLTYFVCPQTGHTIERERPVDKMPVLSFDKIAMDREQDAGAQL